MIKFFKCILLLGIILPVSGAEPEKSVIQIEVSVTENAHQVEEVRLYQNNKLIKSTIEIDVPVPAGEGTLYVQAGSIYVGPT